MTIARMICEFIHVTDAQAACQAIVITQPVVYESRPFRLGRDKMATQFNSPPARGILDHVRGQQRGYDTVLIDIHRCHLRHDEHLSEHTHHHDWIRNDGT